LRSSLLRLPDQFALAATLNAAGYSPIVNGQLSLGMSSRCRWSIRIAHRPDRPVPAIARGTVRDVLLGPRTVAGEVLLGVQLTFGASCSVSPC